MTTPWSFVVPVGPGDGAWRALLQDLDHAPGDSEVVLVFASGHLPTLPPPAPIRCIEAPASRARQLNAGIAAARLPHVCLLHADSRVPAAAFDALQRFEPDGQELGYFDLRFHDGPRRMALNALGAWVRSRLFGLPFGDQGLCARRTLFDQLGGFDPDIGPGEDHALVWRLRLCGGRLRPLRAAIFTSARRYVEHGWSATTFGFLRLTLDQARRFRHTQSPGHGDAAK